MRCSLSALFFLACAAGCYKNHLYVQQQKIDQSFLASSHVGTPDPRQKSPPLGQKLLIAWSFPWSLFSQDLTAITTVRRPRWKAIPMPAPKLYPMPPIPRATRKRPSRRAGR